jgi:vacuolar iron transporter family protein
MSFASSLRRLRTSLGDSAGTIVFGMEDGTVSIFGLIFGVAATTTDTATVLIAGASGAAAAAVSMMAGAYLDVETTRDKIAAERASLGADTGTDAICASLPPRLEAVGLTPEQSTALIGAVRNDRAAVDGLLLALSGEPDLPLNPWEQAFWMLVADFAAAAVPILPFVFLPIVQARILSGAMTTCLLVLLGIGRARIAKRNTLRTVVETVSVGIAAALAGVGIGVLINSSFRG